MKHILTMLVIACNAQAMAQTPACVAPEQAEKLRLEIETGLKQQQADGKAVIDASTKQMELLKLVQTCQEGFDLFGCNTEISNYNNHLRLNGLLREKFDFNDQLLKMKINAFNDAQRRQCKK